MRLLLLLQSACLLAACAPTPTPPPVREPQTVAPSVRCENATDDDFEGEGEEALWSYLDWLVRSHGAPGGLKPHHVSLAIARGKPKPGPGGVTAGEVSCADKRYRIALYRDALTGRPLRVAYRTLAHEFFHVVQIGRDGLDCGAPGVEDRDLYELEAEGFAARVTPACRAGLPTSASARPVDPRCRVARAEDFKDAGAADLQRFADEMTGKLGGEVGLKPGDVNIAFTCATPKTGRRGVIAAEIGCRGTQAPFRITVYCNALEGRRLTVAYHTVAREIQHIVQIRRDGLACEGAAPELADRYEQEATSVADALMPACN